MTTSPAPLTPALLVFTVAYIACTVALFAFDYFVPMPSSSAMGIVALVAATPGAGTKFYSTARRLPNRSEKLRFTAAGLAITFALSALMTVAIFMYSDLPVSVDTFATALQLPVDVLRQMLAIGLAIALVVAGLVLYFTFGMAAKSAMKAAARQAK